MGFNQLRAILASIQEESTEKLRRDLAKWIRHMSELHKHGISILNPSSDDIKDKAGGVTLDQIREYQRIDKKELQEAINGIK
jgi:hypothetical protein